jgi:hypothetical protein
MSEQYFNIGHGLFLPNPLQFAGARVKRFKSKVTTEV